MRRLLLAAALVVAPAAPALADHDRGQDYEDQWSNEDRNRNRDRNRGAFSPGPFRDSPVDAFNNVCMPGATCHYDGREPEDQSPTARSRRDP